MPVSSLLAADLAYILQDVGVSVSHGSVTTYGKLRRTPIQGATDTGLEKVGVDITLILRDGVLANTLVDDAITVDGIAYVIRDTGDVLPDGTRHLALAPWRIAYTGAGGVTASASVAGEGEESYSGAGTLVHPGAALSAAGAEIFSGDAALVHAGASVGAAGTIEQFPSDLASLVAWSEGSDLGADGSAVASWLNKTLSGLDPAQATSGNRPTVKANAINGQKAVQFVAASAQFLMFPAGALGWFQNVAGFTLLVVAQQASAQSGTPVIISASKGDTAAARAQIAGQPSLTRWQAAGRRLDTEGASAAVGGSWSTGTPYIIGGIADFSQPLVSLLVNGASAATIAPGTSGSTSNTASLGIGLGATYLGATPWDGYIAAYAIWNVAYTRAQLDGVLRRWARIYGITLS